MPLLQPVLTVLEIVLLVLVLAFFLNKVAGQLNSISSNLARITFGVRAVETQCAVIGPATDRINANLASAAAGLEQAAAQAERLGR
ncbi:MAG: hypothetical protein M3P97_11110 [Actinomycetota bacterium]|jgi:hypothetical protein|nr:hypothetical protein [Actinomycetota bacterium]